MPSFHMTKSIVCNFMTCHQLIQRGTYYSQSYQCYIVHQLKYVGALKMKFVGPIQQQISLLRPH